MTYRCVDCVYSEVIDKYSCDMECIKKREEVKCMQNCCEDLILKPVLFVSHLIYSENLKKNNRKDWSFCDDKARRILIKHGFYGMRVNDED